MARTKRTTQASPPALSTTEQGADSTKQNKNGPSISGNDETTATATESKDHDDDNTNSTSDQGMKNESQTQPTTENLAQPVAAAATYTFKPPFGISQEQVNYKVLKIQSMFSYLSLNETYRMLDDCYCNEDEVTLRLITQNDYLARIQTMLKPANVCPTSNADAPSTSSSTENLTLTDFRSTTTATSSSSSTEIQNIAVMTHLPQQHANEYPLHYYHHSDQNSVTGVAPSQLCMAPPPPYHPQHAYYRPLQPLTSYPMSSPPELPTIITSPPPPPQTTVPLKRGSNYGKKYKKRKAPNTQLPPPPPPSMDDYGSMPPTPIPSFAEMPLDESKEKKRIRSVGRLALDDALKQVKDNPMEQQQAYEGWSAARIRAYGLIDANPNTYYYRFNAPGEEQHKGAWTQAEKELFLKRVQEVGANSQWGIFSQTIPGRVGYQCSNFYRLLIETGELFDSNYVLDDKGKAHYLFDKKTETGEIQKTIRNHYKHKKTHDAAAATTSHSKKIKTVKKKKPKKRNPWDTDEDDDDDDGEYTGKPPPKVKTGTRRSARRSTGA